MDTNQQIQNALDTLNADASSKSITNDLWEWSKLNKTYNIL